MGLASLHETTLARALDMDKPERLYVRLSQGKPLEILSPVTAADVAIQHNISPCDGIHIKNYAMHITYLHSGLKPSPQIRSEGALSGWLAS